MAITPLEQPPVGGGPFPGNWWIRWFYEIKKVTDDIIAAIGSGGGGTITGAANEGSGAGVYDSSASTVSTLVFKSLVAGSNVTITPNTNNITISTSGSGTVTSVDVSGGATGLTFTGGPITTSGVISAGGTLKVGFGGTGSDLSATGGTSQVLKQTTAGGVVTVGQLAASDLSNGTTGTGAAVLASGAVLTTPNLGTPSAVTLNNGTGLPLTTGVTGILPVLNGGSGTSTPSLVAGSNVSITGSWPNQTINSTNPGGTVTSVNASSSVGGLTFSGGPVTSSGTLTLSGTPTLATNVAGGSSNQIVYQTATSTTGFITAPSVSSTFLEWNGSAFVWAAPSSGVPATPTAMQTDLVVVDNTQMLARDPIVAGYDEKMYAGFNAAIIQV